MTRLPAPDSRQVVSFDPRYLDWVLSGTKSRTTRYRDPVRLGPARFRFETDPVTYVDAEVTGLRTVRLDRLTDADAAAENFGSTEELREALRHHYPGIGDDADVTVVSFVVHEWPRTSHHDDAAGSKGL